MTVKLLQGHTLDVLKTLEPKSVHCAVTSPPYWGLRDYQTPGVEWPAVSYSPMPGLPELDIPAWPGSLGLEPTPEMFVAHIVLIFREVWRVLRDDAVLWLNFGDSFSSGASGQSGASPTSTMNNANKGANKKGRTAPYKGLPPKNLIGIPWRVAFALQADGWYLRSDIIWQKKNPMPESVRDRPTKAHEYLFLLAKSKRYFYDAEAIKEPSTGKVGSAADFVRTTKEAHVPGKACKQHRLERKHTSDNGKRNRRTVWTISTTPYPGAHFATFPTKLVEPCIKAGTSEAGVCSACGAQWVRVVERKAEKHNQAAAQQRIDASGGALNGGTKMSTLGGMTKFVQTTTTGFISQCTCAAPAVPATVLDIFNGSGTTGLVAKELGRDYFGIDLNPEYLELARQRINTAQPRLFENGTIEAEEKEKQLAF